MTFKDFFDYVQTADRDYYGVHDLEDCQLHIYGGRWQVNLMEGDTYLGNFIFDEDKVNVVYVTRFGIAEYDSPNYFPLSTRVNSNDWVYALKETGSIAQNILIKILRRTKS